MIIHDYIFYFFLYSFIGWFFESCYCSLRPKKWINRGFLRGPFCPIYGTGALVILICLLPFRSLTQNHYINEFIIFAVGMVVCDLVEYFTSFIMEKFFNARWWDYSEQPFNLHGRICLTHTLYWGTASCLFIYVVQPIIDIYFVSQIDVESRKMIVYLVGTVFTLDLILTVINALGIRARINKHTELYEDIVEFTNIVFNATGTKIEEFSDEKQKELKQKFNEFNERKDKIFEIEKKKYLKVFKRFNRQFPTVFDKVKNQRENIKKLLDDLIDFIND